VRVAELASSMLWAAPLVALLSVPAAVLMDLDPARQPERAAFLFAMGLLGTWATLAVSKPFDGRGDSASRRALAVVAGALVGLAGTALAAALDVPFGPVRPGDAFGPREVAEPLAFAGYFALLQPVGGLWWLAARDRKARFRVWPLLRTAGAAGLLALALPVPQPYGLAAAVVSAAATQLVSPWSKEAAVYARYAARAANVRRKVA
jgi:hypothetical protein